MYVTAINRLCLQLLLCNDTQQIILKLNPIYRRFDFSGVVLQETGQKSLWKVKSRQPVGYRGCQTDPVLKELNALNKIFEPGRKWFYRRICVFFQQMRHFVYYHFVLYFIQLNRTLYFSFN